MNRQRWAFLLLTLALAAAFIGEVFIFNRNYTPEFLGKFFYRLTTIKVMPHLNAEKGLILFAVAALLVLAARLVNRTAIEKTRVSLWVEIPLFLLIIAAASWLRFYKVGELPPGAFSEPAYYALDATQIMKGLQVEGSHLPVYFTRGIENAAALVYLFSAIFQFFGVGMAQVQATTSVIGVLSVASLYFALRFMWGVRAALIGGFLFAFMRWHIDYSRMGKHAILTTLAAVFVIYFLFRAYKTRKLQDFILLGASAAVSLYGYSAGRFTPLWVIACILFLLLFKFDFVKQNAKKMLAAFVVAIVVGGPMLGFIVMHPDKYFGRGSNITVFNKARSHEMSFGDKTPVQIAKKNAADTLLAFHRYGEGFAGHNTPGHPLTSFFGGILMVLGLALLLTDILSPVSFFILSGLFFALAPNFITIDWTVAIRSVAAMPFVVLLCIVFLEYYFNAAREAFGRKTLVLIGLLLIPAMVYTAYAETRAYFVAKMWRTGTQHSLTESEMGKYLKGLGPEWRGLVLGSTAQAPGFRFTLYPYSNYREFSPTEDLPVKNPPGKNIVYLFPWHWTQYLPVLKDVYPGGELYSASDEKYGNGHLFNAYKVSADEIEKTAKASGKRGLRVKFYTNAEMSGTPAGDRVEPLILVNGYRIEGLSGPPYSGIWTGRIDIKDAGRHTFRLRSFGHVTMKIDGKKIMDYLPGEEHKWNPALLNTDAEVNLQPGLHPVEITFSEPHKFFVIEFYWKKPGEKEFEIVLPSYLRP